MNYKCPCCGFYTFEEEPDGTYYICPVCFWEDDPIQLQYETYEGGANHISLKEARKNYIEFGACERKYVGNVRQPLENEKTGID